MIKEEEIKFMSGSEEVFGTLYLPEDNTNAKFPAIIMCHGFLSVRLEMQEYPKLLANKGYAVLTFDFRGHGKSGGMRGFISQERGVEDIKNAVNFLSKIDKIDMERLGLCGHSLGGALVVSATAEIPSVKCLVALAPVPRLLYNTALLERFVYMLAYYVNRLYQKLGGKPLYVPYKIKPKHIVLHPDYLKKAEKQDFLQKWMPLDNYLPMKNQDAIKSAKNVSVPTLIMVADKDIAVKPALSKQIYDALSTPANDKEFFVVTNSGHSILSDAQADIAFEKIVSWFDKYLKN